MSAPAAMQVYDVDGVAVAVRGGTAVSAPAAMQVYDVDGVTAGWCRSSRPASRRNRDERAGRDAGWPIDNDPGHGRRRGECSFGSGWLRGAGEGSTAR